MMEIFAKNNNGKKKLTVFWLSSIIDTWWGPKYASWIISEWELHGEPAPSFQELRLGNQWHVQNPVKHVR